MSRDFFWGLVGCSAGIGFIVYGLMQAARTPAVLGGVLVFMGAFLISDGATDRKNRD